MSPGRDRRRPCPCLPVGPRRAGPLGAAYRKAVREQSDRDRSRAAERPAPADAGPEGHRSARLLAAGHAFAQNLRRGHYRHRHQRPRSPSAPHRLRRPGHHHLTGRASGMMLRSCPGRHNATVPLRCYRPHRRGDYNAALRVARPRTAERIGQAAACPIRGPIPSIGGADWDVDAAEPASRTGRRDFTMWVFLSGRLRRWVLLAVALPLARLLVHRVAGAAERHDPSTRTARALHQADSAVSAVSRRGSRRASR